MLHQIQEVAVLIGSWAEGRDVTCSIFMKVFIHCSVSFGSIRGLRVGTRVHFTSRSSFGLSF